MGFLKDKRALLAIPCGARSYVRSSRLGVTWLLAFREQDFFRSYAPVAFRLRHRSFQVDKGKAKAKELERTHCARYLSPEHRLLYTNTLQYRACRTSTLNVIGCRRL